MKIIKTVKAMQTAAAFLRARKKRIGFVPTLGALHEGHASLMRRCRRENDLAVLSIFVNPKQFGPHEDYRRYPRTRRNDYAYARRENMDIIFHPSVEEVYPNNYLTSVEVKAISNALCGSFRPGHFQGVATVVAKLLNIICPHNLYLGQKDGQQVVILKKMIVDLNFPVSVKVCPTVREKDGLAMSSRNLYLNPDQRPQASILYQSLTQAKKKILSGERRAVSILKFIKEKIQANSSARIDYIACVDAHTLTPLNIIKGKAMIALAARFGRTRLIDNILVQPK